MFEKLPNLSDRANWQGAKVLVRGSLNVPVENGVVEHEFRLLRTLETVTYLTTRGAKVILCGHLGRDPHESMEPVYAALQKHISVQFVPALTGSAVTAAVDALTEGQVLLLENTRSDEREITNDDSLARELAALADVFVLDAFAVAHRDQASVVGVAKYVPSYAGLTFAHEYDELSKALVPQNPSVFTLGGAKFDTKIPLVEKFIDLYDVIFIGGALANDFFKARGCEVGNSLISDIDLRSSSLVTHPKVLLPMDVIVTGPTGVRTCTPTEVQIQETIVDVGPATVAMLEPTIAHAQTILWNGPLGNYEEGYVDSTHAVAQRIAAAHAYSVIGGGDTVAAIESLGLSEKFSFLSTAGGAMLTYLELGTLPGIEAIRNAPNAKQI